MIDYAPKTRWKAFAEDGKPLNSNNLPELTNIKAGYLASGHMDHDMLMDIPDDDLFTALDLLEDRRKMISREISRRCCQ